LKKEYISTKLRKNVYDELVTLRRELGMSFNDIIKELLEIGKATLIGRRIERLNKLKEVST